MRALFSLLMLAALCRSSLAKGGGGGGHSSSSAHSNAVSEGHSSESSSSRESHGGESSSSNIGSHESNAGAGENASVGPSYPHWVFNHYTVQHPDGTTQEIGDGIRTEWLVAFGTAVVLIGCWVIFTFIRVCISDSKR